MLILSKKNGHFEVGTKGCWVKLLYKCLEHYFNAFKIALVKLRECSVGCGTGMLLGSLVDGANPSVVASSLWGWTRGHGELLTAHCPP